LTVRKRYGGLPAFFIPASTWSTLVRKPKILFFDLETRPNLGYIWAKYEQNVLAYEREWELLSFAWKWQGDRAVQVDSAEGEASDKRLVTKLRGLFAEADVLVAHNGDEFDIKKAKARMIFYRLSPPKVLTSVDTRKVARRYFNFNSNSLNDLGTFLGLGKKVKHTGFDLWLGCMRGDAASWKLMRRYNRQDVVLLEKVYNTFRPWIENHPSIARLLNPGSKALGVCPTCNSARVERRGFKAAQMQVRQQWVCKDCSRWFVTRLLNKKEAA
jgi:uncharacterized protein YprB with RNaseH-like and TPR domain